MKTTQCQKKRFDSPKGFTLVEVMVTVLIFAVLAGAINMVLLVGESSWHINRAETEMIQELRKAIMLMEDELRETAQDRITAGPIAANGSSSPSITFQPRAVTQVAGIDTPTWNPTIQYFLGEDLNDNGSLDAGEDVNGNGTLDAGEDANANGVLDAGEDLNGDGILTGVPLLRIESSGTRIVAHGISSLGFSRTFVTSNMIDVTLAATRETIDGRVLSLEFGFSARMRN